MQRQITLQIKIGDRIEWNQGRGKKACGTVISIKNGGYEVETGFKTIPIKIVKLSADPKIIKKG